MSASGIITLGLLQTPSLVITLGYYPGAVVATVVGCTQAIQVYQPGAVAVQAYQPGAVATQIGCK